MALMDNMATDRDTCLVSAMGEGGHVRSTEARDPMWLVGIVGLAMVYVGTQAILMAMAWWPLALVLGAVLLLPAWRMHPGKNARALRLILWGLAAASLVVGAFLGVASEF